MGTSFEVATIRVLLVDDSETFRETTKQLLLTSEDIQVVGEAGDGMTALEEVRRQSPDVVIMDCLMPDMDGAAATRLIRGEFPSVRVVGLSTGDPDLLQSLREAGADLVLEKGAGPLELGDAVRLAANTSEPHRAPERNEEHR